MICVINGRKASRLLFKYFFSNLGGLEVLVFTDIADAGWGGGGGPKLWKHADILLKHSLSLIYLYFLRESMFGQFLKNRASETC